MSKKDYQAIAAALYRVHQEDIPAPGFPPQPAVRFDMVIGAIADVLAQGNPRFDRERFIEACETGRCRGMRPVAA